MQYDAYLAGGWFNPEQVARIEAARVTLADRGLSFYDPQSMCLCPPDASEDFASYVLNENLKQIRDASFVYASIAGRDLGTSFEVGYAYAMGKRVEYDARCRDSDVLAKAEFAASLAFANRYHSGRAEYGPITVCNTADKDPLQVALAGYAYAKGHRVIYYCEGLPAEASVNLMLAKTGIAVCTTAEDVTATLELALQNRNWSRPYAGGPIE